MTIKYFVENILLVREDYHHIVISLGQDNDAFYDDLTEEQKNKEIRGIYFSSYFHPSDYKILKDVYIYTY